MKIYINDLPDVLVNLCNLYADDNKVISLVNNKLKNSTLQQDIDSLTERSHDWLVNLNFGKRHIMHFGNSNPCIEYEMMDSGTMKNIGTSALEKDIGVQTT